MNLPFIHEKNLYHWGTMDLNTTLKHNQSLEGNNLSLSNCPQDWGKLLKLHESSKLYQFDKEQANFVDILSLTMNIEYAQVKNELIENAFKQELLEYKTIYKYEYQDENGEDVFQTFETIEEAIDEACEEEITKHLSLVGTIKLQEDLGISNDLALSSGEEYAIISLLKKDSKIDGIFWNYEKDILSYSLPIYCIFPEKIKEWDYKIVDSNFSPEVKNDFKIHKKYKV